MIYLLDKDMTVFKVVPRKVIIELWQKVGINTASTLEGQVQLTEEWQEHFDNAFYYAIHDREDKYSFFIYKMIHNKADNHYINLYGIDLGYDEMRGKGYVQDYRPTNRSARTVFNRLIQDTGWEISFFDSRLPNVTTTFYYQNRLEAISKFIDHTNAEIEFKVAITGNRITQKYINVYQQQGEYNGKRFVYGSNALTIERELDKAELYTALVGRGKGEEVGETEAGDATYGRRINFKDVVWSKANGDPVDKPRGQEFVELPEATALYGYTDGKPRMDIRVYEDIEDPEELLRATYADLVEAARPKVQFKSTVARMGNVGKGDTVAIIRHDLNIKYKTRVFNLERNLLNHDLTEVKVGDVIVQSQGKRQNELNKRINGLESSINDGLNRIVKEISIVAADGTKITWSETEPSTMKPGDIWYKKLPNGTEEMFRWNGEFWEETISSKLMRENKRAIEAHQQEIQSAQRSADTANQQINDAINAAGFSTLADLTADIQSISTRADANALAARDSALAARDSALAARDSALAALDNALAARDSALAALDSALAARDSALAASTTAQSAMTLATDLSGQVSDFELTVNGFNQTVNNYTNQVAQFTSDVNGLNSTVASYETQVNEFGNTVSRYATQVSQFENTVNGLNSTVSSLRSDVQGYQSQVSTLTNTVNGFNATVQRVQADYNNLNGTVQSLGASIGVVQGQITNRVWQTDIRSAIDGIEVGGRNLLVGSKDYSGPWVNRHRWRISSDTHKGTLIASRTDAWLGLGQRFNVFKGEQYTFSAYVKATRNVVLLILTNQSGSASLSPSNRTITLEPDTWTHVVCVISVNRDGIMFPRFELTVSGETVFVSAMKLERGNKATDWTPAPEDTLQLISNVETEWRQTAQGFAQSITRVETDLNGKASLTAFNTLTSTVNGTITRVGNAEGRLTTVETNVNGLQTTVNSKADSSTVTQLANLVDTKVSNDDYQAQMSTMANNINARVSKGDVMSQINIEAGRTLIDTGRLYLSANTTVFGGSAFIPNAAIESLSANKLTAGTIDAMKINVINLNVSSLVGNTSEFIRSGWNSAAGGSVSISGSGISSHAPDNSQVYIQNGIMGVRNPSGATLGHIGYHWETNRAFYHIQTSLGTNFAISALIGSPSSSIRRTMLDIFPGSSETYIRTNEFRHIGATGDNTLPIARFSGRVILDDELRLADGNIVNPYGVYFNNGGSIYALSSNSNLRIDANTNLFLRTNNTNTALWFDRTHAYMQRTLSMQGNNITNQSDARLKTNIVEHEQSSLERIKAFNFVDFTWIKNGREDFGLIAQEVQQVAPELISEDSQGILSINNTLINMMTTHAIQELSKEHENTLLVASHAYLLAEQHEDELEFLRKEVKELKDEIEQLRGMCV